MAFTKYILPALAVVAAVSAQCDGPRTEVQNQGDLTALASCSKLTGDLVIQENSAGTLDIPGIQEITGNLVCQNAGGLTSISSSTLTTIGGTFGLSNLTILSTLKMDVLTTVDEIQWVGLPALQSLAFREGISSTNRILVSNTQLASLSGIELETVGTMDINNNNYLTTVNVNNLANVTESLSFSANAADLQISFPNLESAANLTFRNASSVTCPSLSQVNGSMGFYSNTFMSFSAPNLTSTGGSLAIVDSNNLNNLSFPMLTQIGGAFLIANNSNLKSIDGFPVLSVVVGALDFSGSFDNATFPALKDVRGGLNAQTSSTTFSCSEFQQDKANSIIKGTYTCASKQTKPGSAGTTPSGAGASGTSTSKSDAGSFDPSAPLTGLSWLIAAILMI